MFLGAFYISDMKYPSVQEIHSIFLEYPKLSKDTRAITNNCIYIAFKGDVFDGNQFVTQAFEKGAKYAIIDDEEFYINEHCILVHDVLETTQKLANYHRNQFHIPVIAISGSNGKTTTKELIAATLAKKYQVLYTQGNYNNHIGVPLTLLNLTAEHEIAIIEMGANHQKEIDFLCAIAEPTHGMLTNIGKAHLEGFGGIEGVKKGKSELYRFLEKVKGTTFLNSSDPTLNDLNNNKNLVRYGINKDGYCIGKLTKTHPRLEGYWACGVSKGVMRPKLYGEYNFYNILAAICIGNHFNVTSSDIDEAINNYESDMNRSQFVQQNDYSILLDAYNANPTSTSLAIDNFDKEERQNKVAILGDMFELGDMEEEEHFNIIQQSFSKQSISLFVFVGSIYARHAQSVPNRLFFNTTLEAKEWFRTFNKQDHTFLLKGSRGMKMESIIK